MTRIGERAVVIGASMAGLLAARALADFYGTVTVLERDTFPLSDLPRKGVPHGCRVPGFQTPPDIFLTIRSRRPANRFRPAPVSADAHGGASP